MKILITGATGFAACHLLQFLVDDHDETEEYIGLSRAGQWRPGFGHLAPHIRLQPFEWKSAAKLKALLKQEKPDQIYHLAGYTNAGASFREPAAAWRGNLETTRLLFDAIAAWGGKPRVLLASSAAVYGEANGLITETTELRPNSPYGASKAAADLLGHQVWRSAGIPVIRARLFNVCGAGLPPTFALGQFAQQIVEIERGRREPILKVGDLSAERDYVDIRDAVAAYSNLVALGQPGEAYNVASGKSRPMSRLLAELLRLSTKKVSVEVDPSRLRPAETKKLRVDIAKFMGLAKWRPKFRVRESLGRLLEHVRRTLP